MMDWRASRAESRARYRAKFDAAEAERYDALVGRFDAEDEDAYLADLREVVDLREGMRVLDVGAGTGILCKVLVRVDGLEVTALEPAPAMLARLTARPELQAVRAVEGFCDAPEDRHQFAANAFDVILSRQLVNGLYDPLAAFANWHAWLEPGGAVVVIDGLYDRAAWTGVWEEEVDTLPLSACRSTAAIPYLLEVADFRVDVVAPMRRANARPSTRTARYVTVARKPSEA